jgi:predicted RNA-binding Zn ribbon-like protein
MGALEEIRDFVNTADLEAGTDALTDAGAREIREAIRVLLRGNNGLDVEAAPALRVLNEAAVLGARFAAGGIEFAAAEPILARVAEAMADGSWSRLKACRSDTCQWAFIDTARNHSRQWCDMAVCGNRAKARRFRSRHA